MNNVKRAALVALFCGLGGIILHSQTDLRFGFQLSPTFGWMNTNENYINRSDGPNLGLKLAVLGERYFRENYAVTFGIGFAFNMGGTLLYEYPGKYWTRSDLGTGLDTLSGKPKLKYSVNYLEIPLGLKMRTREFGYFRFFGEPMVVLGFKNQSTGRIKSVTDAEDINIKKEVNGLNLSWGLGGGAEYSISQSTALVFGLYYQKGFTDATDDNGTIFHPQGNRTDKSKATMNGITLRLGVLF